MKSFNAQLQVHLRKRCVAAAAAVVVVANPAVFDSTIAVGVDPARLNLCYIES